MGRRGSAIAACLIALLSACNTATTVTSSPTPAPSLPSAPPASARPSASPDPGRAAVAAFVAFASNPKASYQATFRGESRQSVTIVSITKGVLQVSGRDVLVRAVFTFPDRKSGVVEHRFVDGKAWVRLRSGPWQTFRGFTAADSMAAFPFVHGAADVTYLGPKKVAGRTLYQVLVQSAIVSPAMLPESNLSDAAVSSSKMRLLVDAAGRPVSGADVIDGRGRVSGQLQELIIDLDVTFTKVGQPVSIAAP
jgi:hypothetical protein